MSPNEQPTAHADLNDLCEAHYALYADDIPLTPAQQAQADQLEAAIRDHPDNQPR